MSLYHLIVFPVKNGEIPKLLPDCLVKASGKAEAISKGRLLLEAINPNQEFVVDAIHAGIS